MLCAVQPVANAVPVRKSARRPRPRQAFRAAAHEFLVRSPRCPKLGHCCHPTAATEQHGTPGAFVGVERILSDAFHVERLPPWAGEPKAPKAAPPASGH